MTEKTNTIYIAEDGKEFTIKSECLKYEKQLENDTYWQVVNSPDLTEGRGYYGKILLKVVNVPKYYPIAELVEDWAFNKFGKKVAFVQGVQPMVNFHVTQIDIKEYGLKRGIKCGDYTQPPTFAVLGMSGNNDVGLVEINP